METESRIGTDMATVPNHFTQRMHSSRCFWTRPAVASDAGANAGQIPKYQLLRSAADRNKLDLANTVPADRKSSTRLSYEALDLEAKFVWPQRIEKLRKAGTGS